MKDNLLEKIKNILDKRTSISEDEIRSLMILLSKMLELMTEDEKRRYLTLNLFCNWCKHTKISQSNTGLRIIAHVNDILVRVKSSKDISEIQSNLSEAIGYVALRKEIISFLNFTGLDTDNVKDNSIWAHILTHILEIIRDVPLEFPPISSLDSTKLGIYNRIATNPIKPGAGIVMMKITEIDYSKLGVPNGSKLFSLYLKSEDTTNLIVPLLMNASLI